MYGGCTELDDESGRAGEEMREEMRSMGELIGHEIPPRREMPPASDVRLLRAGGRRVGESGLEEGEVRDWERGEGEEEGD